MKQYDPLKKKLRGYTLDVDKEKLWQQTVHAIPQKKKQRPLVIPFLITGLMLSSAFAYYFIGGRGVDAVAYHDMIAHATTNQTPVLTNSTTYHTITNTTSETKTDSPVENQERFEENKFTHTYRQNHQPPKKSAASFSNTEFSKEIPVSAPGPEDPEQIDQTNSIETNHRSSFNTLQTPDRGSQSSDDAHSERLTVSTGLQWETTPVDALPIAPFPAEADQEIIGNTYSGTTPGSPYKKVFSVSFLQGLGFTTLTFEAGDQQAEEMQDFLSPATRSLESLSSTLRGSIQFTKGFAVSAGLTYRQLSTETNFNNTTTARTEGDGITTIVIDERGQQQLISGNIGSTHLQEIAYTRYTNYQNVEMELTAYKRIFGFHRTTVNGYLKAGVNVHYAAQGSAFSSEMELIRFQEADNPYVRSSPFTWGAGMDIQHRLSPSWILMGTAGIDQLNVHHQNYSQLNWKHTIYAFSLGVGYVL